MGDSSKVPLSPDQAQAMVAAVIRDLEAKNLDWSVILAVMANMALNRGQSQLAKTLVEAAHAVYEGRDFLGGTNQPIL